MRRIEPLRPEDPARIGAYRLTGRLGEGGQGIVYRAEERDGTPVALKVLHPRLLRGARAYERLSDEVMTFAATGRPAFGTDSVAAVFHRILSDEPDIGGVPNPYRDVLRRCLDKDPRERPKAREILLRLLGYEDVETAASAIALPEGARMLLDKVPVRTVAADWLHQTGLVAAQGARTP